MLSAQVATSMRGPSISPALIASRSPTSTSSPPPTSRQVVKPARIVLRQLTTPAIAARAALLFMRSAGGRPTRDERWVWQSINPGSRVTSPRSITSRSAGAPVRTASMVSAETTTHTGPRAAAERPSIRCAAWIAKRGGSGRASAACAAGATASAARASRATGK